MSPHLARKGQPISRGVGTQEAVSAGIDVSKAVVDVAVRPGDERRRLVRDEDGPRELASRLSALGHTRVVLEASGGLELPLVAALAATSLPVVVVNPRQVRDFARATRKLAKTDTLDAAVLAHFADAVRPALRPLRREETQALTDLVTRRHQLITMPVAEQNRRRAASAAARPQIEVHVDRLETEFRRVDDELRQTLQRSPHWRERDELLRSVPRVGAQLSPTLMAQLPELGGLDRRRIAALGGLTIRQLLSDAAMIAIPAIAVAQCLAKWLIDLVDSHWSRPGIQC